MRRRRRTPRLRLISWNVHVGNSPATIRRALIVLAAMFRPHVIVLQEAKRFTGTIPGYRRHAADDSTAKDAANCVTLVRRGARNVRGGPEHVPGKGWSYKGNRKPPRTFYSNRLTRGGVRWHVLNVHRCVGGPNGNNVAEWMAEDATIVGWAQQRPEGVLVILGDQQNDHAKPRDPGSTANLADRLGADILTPGGIDYALTRGAGGKIRKLARMFGSDHAPVLVTLTARNH